MNRISISYVDNHTTKMWQSFQFSHSNDLAYSVGFLIKVWFEKKELSYAFLAIATFRIKYDLTELEMQLGGQECLCTVHKYSSHHAWQGRK